MTDTYLILIVVLFALAIFDLVVGVSNDAVNFLNSAIGSNVAKRRVIMIIASIGIFLGAALSDGMMEVARKGVFYPESFFFEDIMVVFLAVMITDIILLDLFNTFGMPTSTTVSIVFELLGSAVMVSLIKMNQLDQGIGHISEYINWANAGNIILGILLSVVIAFTVGSLIMYFSRLLFSFDYKKKSKVIGPVWGGLALTAMTYFLFVKGLKHVAGLPDTFRTMLDEQVYLVLGASFAFWSIVLLIISNTTKFNIMRFVVLFGTFALAMAFAGNDLVNFIGVPMAGLKSYETWNSLGQPENMSMSILSQKVETNVFYLIAAGGIMVVTLWLSKKARSVTETEVKLGRQDEGTERFNPNFFSRGIVSASRAVNNVFVSILPAGLSAKMSAPFDPSRKEIPLAGQEAADFDMIRASVNLAVASMIISYASSLKLPLSTTYVSFMVAMGASLADRAWGRDSAVYRVAGVVNVILGWFGTALIAFTASATFAFVIYQFGLWGMGALLLLAAGLVIRSNFVHKKRESKKEKVNVAISAKGDVGPDAVLSQVRRRVSLNLETVEKSLDRSINGLLEEEKDVLREARASMDLVAEENEAFRASLYSFLKRIQEEDTDAARMYLRTYDHEQDLVQSTQFVVDACLNHVANVHSPLKEEQSKILSEIQKHMKAYLENVRRVLNLDRISAADLNGVISEKNDILKLVEDLLSIQTEGIRDGDYGSRNSLLTFSVAFEMKDIAAVTARFVKLYYRGQGA